MAETTELSPEARRRRRVIYVRHRVLVLREEMERTIEETRALVERLSNTTSALDPAEQAKLQVRLIYLREHWPILRAEFETIRSERRAQADGAQGKSKTKKKLQENVSSQGEKKSPSRKKKMSKTGK